MANNKRRNEFQDPDYPCKKNKLQHVSPDDRRNRIKSIITREFQKELQSKEHEIMKLSSKILEAKNLLKRVRYAVVAQYYSKPKLVISEMENQSLDADENTAEKCGAETQKPLHPSLKQLLGKRPVNLDDILQARPIRKAAKTASTTISEKLRSKKEERLLKQAHLQSSKGNDSIENMEKIPVEVIEPLRRELQPIPQLNAARGRNQTKHLIVVGNTSKYIGDEKSADGVTHKWLVYIRTKTETPIEKIVSKIRFFLHPSYKPNDVVEIASSPFQLSRRGWGEFPIRVQLFFDGVHQQKPIQIIHNIVLDKKMTGFQTMGAETMVEMYLNKISPAILPPLRINNLIVIPEFEVKKEPESEPNGVTATSIHKNLFSHNCTSEITEPNSEVPSEILNGVNIKSEILNEETLQQSKNAPMINAPPFDDDKQLFTYLGKDGKVKYLEIVCPDGSKLSPDLQNTFIKNYHNIIFNKSKKKTNKPKQISLLKTNNNSLLKINLNSNKSSNNFNEKVQINLKSIQQDHDYCKSAVYYQDTDVETKTNDTKLLHQDNNLDHIDNMNINLASPIKQKINHKEILENVFTKLDFENLEAANKYLLRRIPLFTPLINNLQYKNSFPFMVQSLEIFNSLPVPKRLCFEWLRAKLVNRFVRKHPKFKTIEKDDFWTTKEIILFARKYAYTPTIHSMNGINVESDISLKDMVKNEINREKNSNSTLTVNHDIHEWLNKFKTKTLILEDEIIDVDGDSQYQDELKRKDNYRNSETFENLANITKNKELLLIGNKVKTEATFLNQICSKSKINLGLEEIVPGIMHSSAERVLIQTMKSFVEDVVRRSFPGKMIIGDDNNASLQVDDIINGLSSRNEFDFLTNQHMGIIQPKEQIDNDKIIK